MKSVRGATEERPGFKTAHTISMLPVITLVAERFSRMKLKDDPITCPTASTEEQIDQFFDILYNIDKNISRGNMTLSEISKLEKLSMFLKNHPCSTTYTFQIKKGLNVDCDICSKYLPKLPSEVFDKFSFIPAPLLDASKEYYKKFSEVYGSSPKPNEKDRPSMKLSQELT